MSAVRTYVFELAGRPVEVTVIDCSDAIDIDIGGDWFWDRAQIASAQDVNELLFPIFDAFPTDARPLRIRATPIGLVVVVEHRDTAAPTISMHVERKTPLQ